MRKKASRISLKPRPAPEADGQHTGLLIAVELGSEWPGGMNLTADVRRVVAQLDGETPAQFANRVAETLDSLFDRGRGIQLTTLLLACNERVDPAADSARRSLAGLALGCMARYRTGRVCFTTSPRSGGSLRASVAALARGLFDEWRTAGLEVSVDVGSAAAGEGSFNFTARVA